MEFSASVENTAESEGEVPLSEDLLEDACKPRTSLLPTVISEVEREELAVDNATRHDWIVEGGRPQREVHGLSRRTADFKISPTDPDATPMRLKGGGTHLGYHTQDAGGWGKRRIILAALVTPGEVMDNQPMLDLRLPCVLPLACAAQTGHRRYQVWNDREYQSHRRCTHSSLRSLTRLGAHDAL